MASYSFILNGKHEYIIEAHCENFNIRNTDYGVDGSPEWAEVDLDLSKISIIAGSTGEYLYGKRRELVMKIIEAQYPDWWNYISERLIEDWRE